MSDNARPESKELKAVQELEVLVRHLADELAAFRRRALQAEARLKDVGANPDGAANLELSSRAAELENENEQLRAKLEVANTRAKQMLDRVRFLRQQTQAGASER
jgi:hypothetical protein